MVLFVIFLFLFLAFFIFILIKYPIFQKTNVEKIKDIMKSMDSIDESYDLEESSSSSLPTPSFYQSLNSTSIYINNKKHDFENTIIDFFKYVFIYFESSFFSFLSPISKMYYSLKYSV